MYEIKCNGRRILLKENEDLIEKLIEVGIPIFLPCGGRGICEKCKVKVVYRDGRIDDVLLCTLKDLSTVEEIFTENLDLKVSEEIEPPFGFKIDDPFKVKNKSAVDLGTTKISVANINKTNLLEKFTITNPQIVYSRDIISRCKPELKRKLRKMVIDPILKLTKGDVIAISGNTVMQGIVMEENLEGLTRYPFDLGKKDFRFIEQSGKKLIILPEMGGFLGGDAVSLTLTTLFFEKPVLAIDIGTNTEIILTWEEKILAASVPAGSALEGGSIKYGIGPVEGAIFRVKEDLMVETIGGKKPKGFCGSGIISLINALKKRGLVDDRGTLLLGKEIMVGGVTFTQEDIREVQVAKSAIYAAIKVLMEKASLTSIKSVIIAGNLGYHISKEDFLGIKILPEELASSSFFYVGNSSIWGARWALLSTEAQEKMREIMKKSKVVRLTEEKNFEIYYLTGMNL
ncbi:MAG: ASKHA domain-containing protein [Thermosulfidibacteraceae bacterium]|jgi:uncharacterized 2Fe-2S/4Fe-4S cluster protein (DUF4445 family)